MPASQELEHFGLKISAEPIEEPDPVYFTEQSPEFEITVYNPEDARFEWNADSVIRWTLIVGPHQEVVHADEVEFGPLDRGEKTTVTAGGKVLAYEGHGVVGISLGGATGKGGSDRRTLRAGSGSGNPAYSFSVWDKSHYDASIRQPKSLQKGLLLTSIVLILFALVQLAVAFL